MKAPCLVMNANNRLLTQLCSSVTWRCNRFLHLCAFVSVLQCCWPRRCVRCAAPAAAPLCPRHSSTWRGNGSWLRLHLLCTGLDTGWNGWHPSHFGVLSSLVKTMKFLPKRDGGKVPLLSVSGCAAGPGCREGAAVTAEVKCQGPECT